MNIVYEIEKINIDEVKDEIKDEKKKNKVCSSN